MQILSEILKARVAESGERIFCSFQDQQMTFKELYDRVQEVAGALVEAGIEPGDRVGLMLNSSLEHIELYLAIAWLGAISVPISVHLKSAGLELLFNSCSPRLVVAERRYADAIRQAASETVSSPSVAWLEDGTNGPGEFHLNGLLRTSRAVRNAVIRSFDDPFMISYTSGTTGGPKGAIISERYRWVGCKSAAIISDAQPDDTYLLWESFYHGAAWVTIEMALRKGLKVHMVERFSASRLWDQIAEGGVTKLHYTGGVVNIILAQPPVESERSNTVSIAWGAACPADSWRKFEERFQLKVREGYGLSEGQNFTHMNLRGVVGSCGLPIEELDSWIADQNGDRVGPGVVGEIVLKQKIPGITMTGYWGEPEKTAEVLRNGCVFTGDLGMVDDENYFYFKGRKKDALRRRGQNISAWEVERVLNASPDVEESAVIGVDSGLGDHDQDILAVVTLRDGAKQDPIAILKFCAEQLAYYQVPRFIQFVDAFPRGPTQRIMKKHISVDLEKAWDAEKAGVKPTRTA